MAREALLRRYLFAGAVIVSISLPLNAQLQNGDFEDSGAPDAPPNGWNVKKGKLLSDGKIRVSGNFAGKLEGGDEVASAFQDIDVTPGKAYTLSGQWRNGDKTADFDVVTATISYVDKRGGTEGFLASSQDSGPVVSTWKAFELTPVVIPANVNTVRITIRSRFGIGAFDALSFTEMDLATAQAAIAAAKNRTATTPSGRVAGGGSAGVGATNPGTSGGWFTNLDTARLAAQSQQKPVLLFFHEPEAEISQYFESQVFNQPAVTAALQRYIPVKLDFVANRALAYQLKVFRAGTVVTYDPQENCLAVIQEPLPADKFAAKIGF